MKLLIMADASPRMGTGHIMRCIALAQAAMANGINAHMLCRSTVKWVEARLRRESFSVALTSQSAPREDNPSECLRRLREAASPAADAYVALDGYHFTYQCQQAIREAGYKLLVIDDYAHLAAYSCDFLLNSSVCAKDFAYNGAISHKLLGPRYALLRREFLIAREKALSRGCRASARNILVTLGGGDFIDALGNLIGALNNLNSLRGKRIRIIKGSMREDQILAAFAATPARPEILANVVDMPGLLLDTDLCVTAGGSTCFELCCLGVPFMTVEIAENQHDGLMCLSSKYGIPFAANAMLELLLQNEAARAELRDKELALVDGNGARRAIDILSRDSSCK